jgi:hypothetical protein
MAALRVFRLQRPGRDRRPAHDENRQCVAGLIDRQRVNKTRGRLLGRPLFYLTKGNASSSANLGSHFLPLKNHIADDEKNDRGRDHADHLRPGDEDAFAERQRSAEHGALQLAEIDRAERSGGRI